MRAELIEKKTGRMRIPAAANFPRRTQRSRPLDQTAATRPTTPIPNNPGKAECFAPRVSPMASPSSKSQRQRQVLNASALAVAVTSSESGRSVIATGACAIIVDSSAMKPSTPAAQANPAARQTRVPSARSNKACSVQRLARVRACAAAASLS